MPGQHPHEDVTGVVLAGGLARRMGGVDKGLVSVRGRELVRYVVEALQPQVRDLIVNANRNQEIYARLGFRVVADAPPGFHGP
ncbi:MAG: NTP transferase domain-containing protein, partial [Phycisphaerales bacterium]|nr:NTP transferase domain-containing protein [Phycisphaerales bacterium]